MFDDRMIPVELTMVTHRLQTELGLQHARRLRGAVSSQAKRPEFHQHGDGSLLYRHPLIRYDVSMGTADVLGLAAGAVLLRSLPPFDEFRLGPETHRVLERRVEVWRDPIGPTDRPIAYSFRSPYLALNQENHRTWERCGVSNRRRLLERILIGNILSLAKGVDLHVDERLHAKAALEPDGWHELKPGIRLLGFRGEFRVNFALPDRWGIGKSIARGFGTLTRREV